MKSPLLLALVLVVIGAAVAFVLFRDSTGPSAGKAEIAPPAEEDARSEVADAPDVELEVNEPDVRTGPLAGLTTNLGPVKGKNGELLYTLHGRVVDAVSDKPVTGFQMWVARADEGSMDSVALNPSRMRFFNNRLGTFTHRGLAAGRYSVMIRIEGYQQLVVPDVVIPVESQDFVLKLSRGAFIEGTVTNLDGETLSDIEIRLNPVQLDDPTRAPRVMLAITDVDGHYLFSDLPTGTYFVSLANASLGADPSPQVYLGVGANYPVNFQIREHNTVVVRVIDETGRGVVGAHVRLFASGGSIAQRGETDSDGEAEIEHVPAGSYTLKVFRGGYKRVDQPLSITTPEGEVEASVTLALDPNAGKSPDKLTKEEVDALHNVEKQLEESHGKRDGR